MALTTEVQPLASGRARGVLVRLQDRSRSWEQPEDLVAGAPNVMPSPTPTASPALSLCDCIENVYLILHRV